jgi:hypothetical protein
MQDYPGHSWLARYRERVNADRELSVIGDWFTTSMGLTFGERRFALKIDKAASPTSSRELSGFPAVSVAGARSRRG